MNPSAMSAKFGPAENGHQVDTDLKA